MTERKGIRGDGCWSSKIIKNREYVRFSKWIGVSHRVRAEVYGRTQNECIRKMRQKEKEHLEQESVTSATSNPTKNKALLRDAMWNWLITYKRCVLKPKSFDRLVGTYNAHIKNKPLGVTEIRNITPDLIMQHINIEGEMISYSTLKKVYDLLNMFFRDYFAYCPSASPMLAVKKPVKSKELSLDENGIVNDGEMEVLSDEEIEAFLKDLHTERTSICYMMEFALWTFMRTGEIKALQYKDVDMERGEIKIYKSYGRVRKEGSYTKEGCTAMGYEWRLLEPKTKKSKRVFKMSPMAIEALENHLRMIRSKRPDILDSDGNIRPETFIFSTTNGKPYADQNINQLLKTSLKKAGVIKDISFHGLRHSGISYYLRHGADLRIISSLAGHSDVSTTLNIYYNLVREQIDRAYDMEYWKKIS